MNSNISQLGTQHRVEFDDQDNLSMIELPKTEPRDLVHYDPEASEYNDIYKDNEMTIQNHQQRLSRRLNLVGQVLTATTIFFAAGFALVGNPSVAMIILSAFAAGVFLKKA